MENLVVLEFLRKREYQNILLQSFYYKTSDNREVDFVVKEGGKIKQLINLFRSVMIF